MESLQYFDESGPISLKILLISAKTQVSLQFKTILSHDYHNLICNDL